MAEMMKLFVPLKEALGLAFREDAPASPVIGYSLIVILRDF